MGGNLIGEMFLRSQGYIGTFGITKTPEGNSSLIEKGEGDVLNDWLNQNTFNHRVGGYDFYGENGVACRITHRVVETGDVEKARSRIGTFDPDRVNMRMPYARVIRIRYQPVTRGVPQELNDALRQIGYVGMDPDSELVQKAANDFCIG